jgi:hypothetical protein
MDSILNVNQYWSIGFSNDTSTIHTHPYTDPTPYTPLRLYRKQAKVA